MIVTQVPVVNQNLWIIMTAMRITTEKNRQKRDETVILHLLQKSDRSSFGSFGKKTIRKKALTPTTVVKKERLSEKGSLRKG